MLLLAMGQASAFAPKSREHRAHLPAFKAGGMVKEKQDESSSVPGSAPAFAFANPAASMSPAVVQQEEDDEEIIGYGTALISCVISLALGFSLGYGT